jgi:predicted ATP-grasp superfamily ATP-dependent carboligase
MKTPTAFVLSHESNPSRGRDDKAISIIALTLTRALGREGIDVVRVHPNRLDHSLSSRYCKAIEVCPDLYESSDELTSYLIDLASKYEGDRVLIPASDDCSNYLAMHADRLSEHYTVLNPSASTMERVRDKRLQYELAESADVPIPETLFPRDYDHLRHAAESMVNFPYIIKPLVAQKWRLESFAQVANGRKAITVNSKEEMLSEYRRIAEHDAHVMIQEVIAGDDEHLVTFLGYCSEDQKPLAYCIRSKLRQNPVDFGYCSATVTCHNDEVEQYSKRLLAQSEYTGIVGIEFKFDSRAGLYKLIEINTRPVNTTGISIGCGVNLPLIAYRDAIGETLEPITDWPDGVVWVWFEMDFVAARQLRKLGRITYRQWLRSLRGKRVHAILAGDDWRPCINYYAGYLGKQAEKVFAATRIPQLARSLARATTRIW